MRFCAVKQDTFLVSYQLKSRLSPPPPPQKKLARTRNLDPGSTIGS